MPPVDDRGQAPAAGAEVTEWTRRIGLADRDGTTVEVSLVPGDADGPGIVGFHVQTGGAVIHASPGPTACRQLAGALLDAADALDAEVVE